MALKSELMAVGMPASQANRLGFEPGAAVTAAGTTQATATTLVVNNAVVTTSSSGAGVILGSAEQRYSLYNAGPFTLLVYPPVGDTMNGLAQNAGVTLAYNTSAIFDGAGPGAVAWVVS